jgi:hypothetical protein
LHKILKTRDQYHAIKYVFFERVILAGQQFPGLPINTFSSLSAIKQQIPVSHIQYRLCVQLAHFALNRGPGR